jgi:uncharacterized protein YegL
MNTKTNAEMLKALKQYNKTAREGKAKLEGFKDSISMIAYLNGFISSGLGNDIYFSPSIKSTPKDTPQSNPPSQPVKKVKASTNKARPIIHVVDILDASGSMSGAKYKAAVTGINIGVANLKKDTAPVDYTYTLCDFSNDIVFRQTTENLANVGVFKGQTRGATALYDAIGDSIDVVKSVFKDGHKVLVNIYTDGQENSSRRFRAQGIASLIEELSKCGWTFTFIGTQFDVEYAQRNLKFDMSNTLVHDNTGAGMEKAFTTNSVARASYSSKVSAGEDVSKGFYKNIE